MRLEKSQKISKLFKRRYGNEILKNFLGGVAIATLSFGFVSCGESEDDGEAFNGEEISLSNTDTTKNDNGKKYYRSFAGTKTKHYSANALITINNAATVADSSNYVSAAGYGFLFGLEETTSTVNKDAGTTYYESYDSTTKKVGDKAKFYTFGIASVRWNATSGSAEWYVSWCENVPSTCFNYTKESGFSGDVYDVNGNSKRIENNEKTIVKGDPSWKAVSGFSLTDSNFVAQIRVVANDDGSYTVGLYKNAEATSALDTGTIPASTTGFTKKTQKDIGRYITVYAGQTTTGKIEYSDISGNPIPADYAED